VLQAQRRAFTTTGGKKASNGRFFRQRPRAMANSFDGRRMGTKKCFWEALGLSAALFRSVSPFGAGAA